MLCFRCGSYNAENAPKCSVCGQSFIDDAGKAVVSPGRRQSASSVATPVSIFVPGEMVAGRYKIVELLGQGGVGAVYRARDTEIDVDIALKAITPNLLQTEDEQKLFSKQIKAARKLQHPNIVRLYDEGHEGPRRFFTMKLLEGLTLRKIIRLRHEKGQPFSTEELIPIFHQLAAALDYAHKTTWHGDLKPENIIILPDLLKITDFNLVKGLPLKPFLGIAKSRSKGFPYIAPELRVEATQIDGRCDVYSLGVILAEMLTGLTYEGHFTRALSAALEGLPTRLDGLVRRALAEHPDGRFARASDMARELENTLASVPSDGLPPPIKPAAPVPTTGPIVPVSAHPQAAPSARRMEPPPPPLETNPSFAPMTPLVARGHSSVDDSIPDGAPHSAIDSEAMESGEGTDVLDRSDLMGHSQVSDVQSLISELDSIPSDLDSAVRSDQALPRGDSDTDAAVESSESPTRDVPRPARGALPPELSADDDDDEHTTGDGDDLDELGQSQVMLLASEVRPALTLADEHRRAEEKRRADESAKPSAAKPNLVAAEARLKRLEGKNADDTIDEQGLDDDHDDIATTTPRRKRRPVADVPAPDLTVPITSAVADASSGRAKDLVEELESGTGSGAAPAPFVPPPLPAAASSSSIGLTSSEFDGAFEGAFDSRVSLPGDDDGEATTTEQDVPLAAPPPALSSSAPDAPPSSASDRAVKPAHKSRVADATQDQDHAPAGIHDELTALQRDADGIEADGDNESSTSVGLHNTRTREIDNLPSSVIVEDSRATLRPPPPREPSSSNRAAPREPSSSNRAAPREPSSSNRAAPREPSSSNRAAPREPSSSNRAAKAAPATELLPRRESAVPPALQQTLPPTQRPVKPPVRKKSGTNPIAIAAAVTVGVVVLLLAGRALFSDDKKPGDVAAVDKKPVDAGVTMHVEAGGVGVALTGQDPRDVVDAGASDGKKPTDTVAMIDGKKPGDVVTPPTTDGKKPGDVVAAPTPTVADTKEAEERARVAMEQREAQRKVDEQKKLDEQAAAAAAANTVAMASASCPKAMARIEAGSFTFGSTSSDPMRNFGERDATTSTTGTFCIDYYEAPNGKSTQPTTGVSWAAAKTACERAGKRLCSEGEWERACKGPANQRFPYGNAFDADACNTEDADGQAREPQPAQNFKKCRSGFPVYALAGNVEEWTSDALPNGQKIAKGGASDRPDFASRCAARRGLPATKTSNTLGYRCCADPK